MTDSNGTPMYMPVAPAYGGGNGGFGFGDMGSGWWLILLLICLGGWGNGFGGFGGNNAVPFMNTNNDIQRGFDQLLLIPGLMPEGGLAKDERDSARQRMAAFAKRVTDRGYKVLVEDFDNPRSLCYNAELIDTLFTASKELGLVFDTGNFQFAGQDAMEQYEHFRPKIGHVHLKDRTSPTDMRCVAVGTGCIPIVEIIHKLQDSGYEGWYTYEEYGTRTMLKDCEASYMNISAALAE